MSWPSGGHSRSSNGGLPGFGPGAPWPLTGAVPPSSGQHKNYRQTKHEQDKQAAARKRTEERRAMQAEMRKKNEWVGPTDLFSEPKRAQDASQAAEIERVLGSFSADKTGDMGLIGVDYAPPTPAPAREHIIGEEDEEENNQKPYIKKPPPPFPTSSSSRHHPSAMPRPPTSQTKHSSHKEKSSSLHHPSKSSSWKGSMAPPQSPSVPVKPPQPHKPPHQMSSVPPEASSRKNAKQKPSPLKMPNDKKQSVSSKDSIEDDDAQLKNILAEMQQPLPSFSNSGLPTPISIIETPRVDIEDRGCNRTSRPVYPGGFGSWGRSLSPSPPKKPDHPTPAVKLTPEQPYQSPVDPPTKVTKDSSSEQDESTSGSESDDKDGSESDDKDDEAHMGFGLANLKQPIRTPPPSSSERSVNKTTTPSPRFPHPSPLGVMSPSPRASKSVSSQRSGAGSPLVAFPDVPPLIGPLSPMMDAPVGSIMSPLHTKSQDSESEQEESLKMPSTNKVKTKHTPSNSSVPLSSDDELAIEEERRKKMEEDKLGRKRKRKKSSQSSKSNKSVTGSESERGKSRKNKHNDDSDSDSFDTFTVKPNLNKIHTGRSHSTSPLKRPHSKKTTGSAHTTPRPQSTTSTPVRDKLQLTPTSLSKSSKNKSKSHLSESDEEDEVPDKSPPVSGNKQKNTILSKMFKGFGNKGGGGKGGKGGKDGKGRGKGGITVIPREVSNDIDDEPPVVVSKSSPSVRKQSDKLSAAQSPSVGEKEKKSKSWSDNIDRENHSSWANIPPKKALEDDLEISDDDSYSSPGISRHPFLPQPPNQTFKQDPVTGRPTYLISLSLSRLGRSVETLQNKFKLKSKKPVVKQECWITSGDERGGSQGGQSSLNRKRKPSESPVNVKSESDQIRSSDRTTTSHRKSNERTHLESEVSRPESRKRDRDHSPEYDSDNFSKRIRSSPSRPDPISMESAHASYLGQELEPPPPDPSLLPPAHPTWPGPGMMLPPPYPPKRVYYSYFERRHQDEAFDDEEIDVNVKEAGRLKREADQEHNMNERCRKYLLAIMKFTVCGCKTETVGDKINAYQMFIETLGVAKFVMKLTNSKTNLQDVDTRLVVLSLRAQSLLNLQLYKMKRHELKDYQKTLQDVLAKSKDDQSRSDQGQNRTEQMSTPSPAGSEGSNCSKSSDYYSSGENRLPGVLTPPTGPPICLSIPRTVIQNQYSFCSYLSQCHELWDQADLYVGRGMCEEFFIRLDQECGPLTLHSSLKDLVIYTRKGLETLELDRQSSGLLCGLPPAADSFR